MYLVLYSNEFLLLESHRFWIQLFVRDDPIKSLFSIKENHELSDVGLHVEVVDTFFNLTTIKSQLMHGTVPWRGALEKDPLFMQVLIESFTKPGDIVLDWKASTGMLLESYLCFCNLIFCHQEVCMIIYLVFHSCRSVYSCLSSQW